MNLKNILTEREFVVIDPTGNARPVGMKMQGAQYVRGWVALEKDTI